MILLKLKKFVYTIILAFFFVILSFSVIAFRSQDSPANNDDGTSDSSNHSFNDTYTEGCSNTNLYFVDMINSSSNDPDDAVDEDPPTTDPDKNDSNAELSNLEELISNTNSLYISGLQRFISGGVEKPIDMGSITPDMLIETAKSYIGTPHRMGGTSHKGIDCSGLFNVTFSRHGVKIPHSAQDIARYGKIIPNRDSVRKGDLIFFIKTYRTSKFITHAGLMIDRDYMIHASSKRGVEIVYTKGKYWGSKYIFSTRIFENQLTPKD